VEISSAGNVLVIYCEEYKKQLVFKFEDGEFTAYSNIIYPQTEDTARRNLQAAAETVLEAHETLIDADSENQQRFKAVVEMTRQDIDRIKEH
jgi:hypothetical protein